MTRSMVLALALVMAATGAIAAKDKAQDDLAPWLGEWTASEEQFITIVETDTGLSFEGNATWGALHPERVERGGVNVGEFSAEIPRDWIVADAMAFAVAGEGTVPASKADDYDCVIEARLVGDIMEVADNMMCGGMNVTFTGTYRRLAN